jgi:hypothetical protein
MFEGTTKINGISNAIDQGMHNLHSHFKIQTFEVNDDDVMTLKSIFVHHNKLIFWLWK